MAGSLQIETCDTCGRQFVAGYGYSIAACWLVTGSAHVKSYMCEQAGPSGQHWGCTPEHAIQALEKCLADPAHMHLDGLIQKHQEAHRREIPGKPEAVNDAEGNFVEWKTEPTVIQRPRYSDEDAINWADEAYKKRGEDFHIVEVHT